MHLRSSLSLLVLCAISTEALRGKGRQGKVFSLFNIVQFKNDGCISNKLGSGTGNRLGTCYTASECASKTSGTVSGSCAAGFGVCCVFMVTKDKSEVKENCTYIQNPGFPTALAPTGTAATTYQYTINREDNSVCMIRLDFDTLNLQGVDTLGNCIDTMNIVLSDSTQSIPTICGVNDGQHMYLDIGMSKDATAVLTFTLAATGSTAVGRSWDIKTTQIPCSSPSAPPNDCLQYFTGMNGMGMITTFNYAGRLLKNQAYTACIRQEAGMCCIEYMPCAAPAIGFSIVAIAGGAAAHDTAGCITTPTNAKYIGIPGSSSTCNRPVSAPLTSLYCGGTLSTVTGAIVSSPVCDCSTPFQLQVFVGSGVTTMAGNGVCLTWMQKPC